MSDLNRRSFLLTAAATAAAVISLPVLQPYAEADQPAAGAKPIDVGTMADYTKDGATNKFQAKNKIFVVREDSQIYACTSICTHKGAALQLKDDEIFCAKHNSHFTFEGTVTGGPAKKSLPRYAITLGADGHLMVDKSKSFDEKNWTDAASFVPVPKA
jgi:nitrite reductase/ring-hydroxylating ferredoxin subunit